MTEQVPAHRDQRVISESRRILQELKDVSPSLTYVSLLTDDGFEVVRVPERRAENDRLASMASAIQALSEAVARELKIGHSSYVIVEAEHGRVIQRRVPDHSLVIAAVFDDDELLGKALAASRTSAQQLSSVMTTLGHSATRETNPNPSTTTMEN